MATRDRRQEIMTAAEQLFTTRRFHEITLDEVAQAARVGKGTIYRYFQDKDDLFFQTSTSGLDELCALLGQDASAPEPFDRQLLSACRKITDFFDRRRQLFRMMQTQDGHMCLSEGKLRDRWVQRRRALVSALGLILQHGIDQGGLRRDVPAAVLANLLLGMLRSRARDLADMPARHRRLELVIDVFCRGACGDAQRGVKP